LKIGFLHIRLSGVKKKEYLKLVKMLLIVEYMKVKIKQSDNLCHKIKCQTIKNEKRPEFFNSGFPVDVFLV
jgi:hypothetical protein